MDDKTLDVVGIGNAIVDVLLNVEDAFLERQGMAKGAMTLIDAQRAELLYGLMDAGVECSGGSAANTMVGLASLGARAGYIGKVKRDGLGKVFTRDIRAAGVAFDTPDAPDGEGTGRCLIFVTPDGERTLNTFLGASAQLGPEDVNEATVRRARYTYLEGYLWDPAPAKQAFVRAAEIAHRAGGKVALSLSDSFCVERHRDSFLELVGGHVDLLFGNEDEILSLYRTESFDEAIRQLREHCDSAAVTRGSKGSVVLTQDRAFEVPAEPVDQVVDTTGAGDLYAAGFLYGLARGYDPATCARIGGIAAGEIIGHMGARPRRSLAGLVERRGGLPAARGGSR